MTTPEMSPPEVVEEAELRTQFGYPEVLAHLNDRFVQEQGWFWTRFAAFAGLHAGWFVLITSEAVSDPTETWFSLGGVALGVLWSYVQLLSLAYVHRVKAQYYSFRDDFLRLDRLLPRTDGKAPLYMKLLLSLGAERRPNATLLGALTAMLVTVVWGYILVALW